MLKLKLHFAAAVKKNLGKGGENNDLNNFNLQIL